MVDSIRYVDLFSGIGGFRQAMEKLSTDRKFNARCVAYSDIDKFALQSYRANYDTTNETDIGDIVLFTDDVKRIRKMPDFDVLFGGFPCQPFSIMGSQLGLNDARGSLFFSVAKIVTEKRPKMIVLENVRNLISHNDGKTYLRMKQELEMLGYEVEEDVMNTSEFGLPQHRRRLYIIAIDRRVLKQKRLRLKSEDIYSHYYGLGKTSITKYRDVLDNLLATDPVDDKYYLSERIKPTIMANGSKRFVSKSEINQLVARPLTATMVKLHRACQDNYYSQEFLDSPDPHKYLETPYTKEEETKHRIRKLTPVEALKLQGFDEDFYNNAKSAGVSNHQIYRQAGNAVSVNAVYTLLDYLLFEKKYVF